MIFSNEVINIISGDERNPLSASQLTGIPLALNSATNGAELFLTLLSKIQKSP